MPPVELDKDLANTLTPEELEAINGTDHSDEELEAMKTIAGEDDDDDAGGDGENQDGDDEDTPADDAGESSASDTDADNGELAAEQNDPPAELKTQYRADVPDDLDQQIAAVAAEKKDLAQKFREGEIDLDEFNTQSEALDAKRDDLNRIKFKAEVFDDMNAQSGEQAWANAVNTFATATAKADGIDYRKDAEKAADLDLFVKRLAENPANSDKQMNWFLQEAHRRVKALHGIQDKQESKIESDADKLKAARESRKPPIADVPKTLAQVPGGDGPGDVSGEFSDVEGLEGLELEDAIARMTPAQRDRFLKS